MPVSASIKMNQTRSTVRPDGVCVCMNPVMARLQLAAEMMYQFISSLQLAAEVMYQVMASLQSDVRVCTNQWQVLSTLLKLLCSRS
jgi:hypothetical protein